MAVERGKRRRKKRKREARGRNHSCLIDLPYSLRDDGIGVIVHVHLPKVLNMCMYMYLMVR